MLFLDLDQQVGLHTPPRPQSIFSADDTDLWFIYIYIYLQIDIDIYKNLSGFCVWVCVCMCNIPYSKLLVKLVNECISAGEVIGAGPHISAFYTVFNFHNGISEMFYDI